MKAVILAGGYGTRISEESSIRPKPMVEIGDKPILWHIMKIYSQFGICDFIVCCGYKSQVIKDYFSKYALYHSDVTFDMKTNGIEIHKNGVDDIDIQKLINFHKTQGKLATVTAVQPPGRFGAFYLKQDEDKVTNFQEKPKGDGVWISAGFFVLEPKVLDYIKDDTTVWEKGPLEKLSTEGQLCAYRHEGFWQPVDTFRDKITLENLWQGDNPPWKVWKEKK